MNLSSLPLPVFVAAPLIAAFILPLFGKKGKNIATVFANLVTLGLLVFAIASLGNYRVYLVGEWPIPLGINLVLDGFSALMLVTISVVSAAAMMFSAKYMEQYTAKSKFLCLFMLMVAGMNGVVLSGDIFNLFVFLEIASIASYALVAFGCEHEELEAAFKYMVLGSIASSFVLFGIGLVYGNTGTLNMAYISQHVSQNSQNGLGIGLAFAMSLFIVGFGLKAALVPFHAWLPDAHPSAPAPISAMLSGVLIKALGVYVLSRLVFNIFGFPPQVMWILITLGVLSMIIGALLAIGQMDLKRLMAYSSISQIGYCVLGLGLGGILLAKGETKWATMALLGGVFHMANHAVYKSLLFLASGSIEMATGTSDLNKLGGLAGKMPVTSSVATVASAAIAGVPPFSGFWSKLLLVIATVGAGYYWIAVVILLVSVCTLIMYLKVQRYVFLGDCPENLSQTKENCPVMLIPMILLGCLCLLMGLLLISPMRENFLMPAVDVLMSGADYSQNVIDMIRESVSI